jgi:hypothetical protein
VSEGYEIREYRPGDEAGIVRSFNRVFREVCGPGYVDREPASWRWQFAHNPCGHRITLGFSADGEVAAQYAGVPQRMATSFGPAVFVHIVDSFVVPEHRAGLKRPGLFVTTAYPWFELCHRMGDAVLYGYPVKTAERIGQRYLEYKFLRSVDYLCRPAAEGSTEGPGSITVERVRDLPAGTDELAARVASRRGCMVERGARYLRWRYLDAPGAPYELHTAWRGGELAGLAVLRVRHELVPAACTIADWLVPDDDDEAVAALVAVATARARGSGRQTVMAVFADPSPEHAALRARGFAVVPSADLLERRLTHRIYHPRMTTEWLAEHWWYTLGDTDLV